MIEKDMKTYVINLDRRTDRLEYITKHLSDHRIDFIRFSAIDNKWEGCRDSHLAIMEECKDDKVFMILEDDVQFVQPMKAMGDAVTQLPEDWDCLYLGASPKEPQVKYSPNLYKINNAHVTHAIVWRNREGGAVEYILEHRDDIQRIDDYFAKVIQPMFNCFLIYPLTAIQIQTQSDTCKRSNVSTIVTNYHKYCT